jgi:hypothetical protein
MDIATLLESHRKHMLDLFDSDELQESYTAIAHAHDRATTKSLLEHIRSGNSGNGQQPVGQASTAQPITTASRKVKAGSKAARQRALKAGETRRKNLAAKAGQGNLAPVAIAAEPVLSPATHLAPRPPEGGAA